MLGVYILITELGTLGFMIQGSGLTFRVWGLGFRVYGLRFRVKGKGFRSEI
jgi:hypothetical protein